MKMNTLKETMETDGYSREGQYFYELSQKLKDQLFKEQNNEIGSSLKIENNSTSSIPDKKRLDQDAT